ncbi:ribonuclease H-like domain-containing protein [Tanacetum coccineum]
MSEAEPIPPTSSVTALRIPMIKKGEYDLWSMKMRQYIAITDHILWDIITNGDQATTDPVSSSGPVSAPKTSLAANARRNNEKALNILLSAIPDRHLLSFHDAEDAKTLWSAIKARFGGNEASKKMQKNLLKQQFETFTIGSREELDSAYESCLLMGFGQPGLDELEFDDLYNNLKVYEHELKGVSNSNSQNIAFLSTEVKGSTLKQSTVEPAHIPKGYTQAASSTVQTAPNCASHSDEIICSFFAQQASMPTTHDDEDLLQIDEDAMEEIDIRWQVAMITARIRKTGRPIDLKPKNGITFDKSKIECFNCQKLGHFARECRFAKYQENRANGRQEKRIVAIEDSNSKALVATDNNEDIDWTKEFDAEPVTLAMMALTEVEQDDWSMEFDAEHVHFGQDGLGDFDWSNKADDTPVSLALMATNSEVPYCSKCSKSYKKLLESYQTERDNFQKARTEILGYQMSLESLEVILKTHEKNEYAWGDKYEQMEYDLKIRDLKLEEKQKELDQALKERDDFKVKLEKWSNASVLQNEVLNKQRYLSDKSCIGFGVESSSGMESDNSSGNTNSTESFDDEETVLNSSEIQKKTVFNSENSETSFENRSPVVKNMMSSISENGLAQRVTCLVAKATKDEVVLLAQKIGSCQLPKYNNWLKAIRRTPNISFMRPFGCPLTNLIPESFGKFDAVKEALCWDTLLTVKENQKGKGPDWMFDLELLTPSMNYIPVRKENYADSRGQETACDDVDDLDDQQFIVHGPSINPVQNKQHTADKEVPLSSEEQALHDELVSLMHQESLAKLHNDAQRNAFEEEKKRIALDKGKECVDSTFTLSTANTPPQSTGNTPTDSDDDIPKDGCFSIETL